MRDEQENQGPARRDRGLGVDKVLPEAERTERVGDTKEPHHDGKVGAIEITRPARTPASSAVPNVRIHLSPASSPCKPAPPLGSSGCARCRSGPGEKSGRADHPPATGSWRP